MKTFEIARPLTAKALNENLYKQFNVKVNFDKYSRDQLENYRNLLRTKLSQVESNANFNELLTNESYQKDKFLLGVLNTKIKEMIGEAKDGKKKGFVPFKKGEKKGDKKSDKKDDKKKDDKKKDGKKKGENPFAKKNDDKKSVGKKDDKKDSGKKKGFVPFKKKVKESKSVSESIAHYIAEDEEGKAKSITAAADMVSDFTSWMQRVGNYQTKSMIELADNIRANFGVQEAETFKQSVASALEGTLAALTSSREEINNAVSVLAGEAPAQAPMGPEPTADLSLDASAPDTMNAPAASAPGDEFSASDAAAGGPETTGRLKRESIERGNRLMKVLSK